MSGWAGDGRLPSSNQPMSTCSSGALFCGVPCQLRTIQALTSAGSSADPAVSRYRWDAVSVAMCTPSSSRSSRARARSSDSPASTQPPGRSHTSGWTRLVGLRCARRTRPSCVSAPNTTLATRSMCPIAAAALDIWRFVVGFDQLSPAGSVTWKSVPGSRTGRTAQP